MQQAGGEEAAYRRIKRSAVLGSALLACGVGLLLAGMRFPWFGFVWVVGVVCGIINALWSMYVNERLLDKRRVGAFVISSFGRLGLFGIVPVALALRAPSPWTVGIYFVGFFVPLALYAVLAVRVK
jgi:membrane-bound ClpP family serine protease